MVMFCGSVQDVMQSHVYYTPFFRRMEVKSQKIFTQTACGKGDILD